MKKEITPREGMRLINTGPVVVVTCGPAERPNGITLAWNMNVSHEPPMAAVSIAPGRYSHDLIVEGGAFCINVPGEDQLDAVMYMGTHSGRMGDKFAPAGLTPAPAKSVPTVAVAEFPGHVECVLFKTVPAGDHTIFIGEIKAAFAEEGLFDNKRWTLSAMRGRTPHHLGERFFGILERVVEA